MYRSKLLKKTTALKYADVRPAFIKDKTDKENYRPISILPNLSKVYESLMYDQMYPYSDQIFSKLQCGFRKGFNAEQCLINIVEKCRKYIDTGDHDSALLTDFSNAFEYRSSMANCKTKCIWCRYKSPILFNILP